jgi:beta-lactamase superfamily II metal-dependent hydrolase
MTNPISLSSFIDNPCIEELIHTAATEQNCDIEISLNMQGATFEISGPTVQMNNNNNNNEVILTLYQAKKAQRGRRGIAPLFL